MSKPGKKHQQSVKLVEPEKEYQPGEAVVVAKKAAYAKFDETVELHLNMGLNPRNADQQLRGVALLPNGLGKKRRILVLTQGEAVRIAEEAGADYVGGDELIQKIEGGWLDFDVAIASPDMMSKVGKLGKILGRRGLMPNPKSGTVVQPDNLGRAVKEARMGRVEFRLDKTGIVHLALGKASFEEEKLLGNMASVMEAIVKAKPSGAKGQYIKSAFLSTSMGPGIKLDLKSTLDLSTP